VKAIFSRRSKTDLAAQEAWYAAISPRLASAFRERVAAHTREMIHRGGGDHVGPRGFPCRRTKPFPFYVYYKVEEGSMYFLGVVHERPHPDFLKRQLQGEAGA